MAPSDVAVSSRRELRTQTSGKEIDKRANMRGLPDVFAKDQPDRSCGTRARVALARSARAWSARRTWSRAAVFDEQHDEARGRHGGSPVRQTDRFLVETGGAFRFRAVRRSTAKVQPTGLGTVPYNTAISSYQAVSFSPQEA